MMSVDSAMDKQSKLEELRRKREELEAALRASEEQELEEAIHLEEQEMQNLQTLHELSVKHGRIGYKIERVESPPGTLIVVKTPTKEVFARFMSNGDKLATEDYANVCRSCVIHPPAAAFFAMCEEKPALLYSTAGKALGLAGVRAQSVQKKQ